MIKSEEQFLRRSPDQPEIHSLPELVPPRPLLDRWMAMPSNRWIVVLMLVIALGACVVVAASGFPFSAIYGHDLFIQLDGAWRVLHGQRPHIDFYSGFGPVTYWSTALGMKLMNSASGLVWGTVFVGVVLALWVAGILRRRMTALPAVLAAALLSALWLAPFPLGEPFYMISYAMQYNRLGYVLMAILLLELYLPILTAKRRPAVEPGGVSSGISLGLLLFLKVNFFLAALPFVGVAYLLEGKTRRHFHALAAGFVIATLPVLSYLHWNLGAMWNDLRIAAGARQMRLEGREEPFRTLARNGAYLLIVPGFAALAGLLGAKAGIRFRLNPQRQLMLFAAMILGADTALAISNTQRYGFPLSLVGVLILGQQILNRWAGSPPQVRAAQRTAALAVLLGVFITCMPAIVETADGLAEIFRSRDWTWGTDYVVPVAARHLAGIRFLAHSDPVAADYPEDNGPIYTTQINEGMKLIRGHSAENERVICLCFSNPFSYALLRPPAEGGATFFDYATNFTATVSPPPTRILGNAELVIYPKASALRYYETPATLLKICGDELKTRYRFAAESEHWVLLKRTK